MHGASSPGDPGRDRDAQDAHGRSALARVARAVARAPDAQGVFDLVSEAVGRLVTADAAWLIHFDPSDSIRVLATWSDRALTLPVGSRQELSDEMRAIRRSALPYRMVLTELDPDSSSAVEARRLGIVSSVGVPVMLAGAVWGLAVAARFGPEAFTDGTEDRMSAFLESVTPALAAALADAEREDWHAEQAALRKLARLAATDLQSDDMLRAVVTEASTLFPSHTVTLSRIEEGGTHGVLVATSDDRSPVGYRFPIEGESVGARILRSGHAERIDDFVGAPGIAAAELGVRAVVGVPVQVEGRVWGFMGVVSFDGPIPSGTEDRLAQFAAVAAATVASAQVRADLRELADAQAALLRVAELVARGVGERELFDAVAVEASGLIGNEAVTLARRDGPRTFTVIASCRGQVPVGFVLEVPLGDPGTVDEVIRTHRPARRDDYEIQTSPQFAGRAFGPSSGVSVPIIVEDLLWGVLGTVAEGRRLPTATEHRLQQFAELVGAAIANSQARAELQLLADERSALLRVAELVAHGAGERELFATVAEEAARLVGNEGTTLARYEGDRTFTVVATSGGPAALGTRFVVPVDDVGTSSELLRTRRAARLDSYDETPGPSYAQRDFGIASSVSVPIIVEGELWGSMGTVTQGRRLPANTEDRLQKFADLVAAAIANSQARAVVIKLADEQAALRRVAELVARGASLAEVFDDVSSEASRLLASPTALVRFDEGGPVVAASHSSSPSTPGGELDASELRRLFGPGPGSPVPPDRDVIAAARAGGIDGYAAVPVVVEGRTWGALLTRTSGGPPTATTADQLDKFAALAAAAIANAENKSELTASRARVVATADDTRRRLQRDVHDGAQQRLVQTVLTLKLARDAADAGESTAELIDEALRYAERATTELRDLVHGILPASLSRGGLRSGIESLVADLPTPVQLDFDAPRLPAELEITAYFVVAEALTNVVKHAGATRASVAIRLYEGRLTITVGDDGVGGADAARGSGLTGLRDRVEAAEGTISVTSPDGDGTLVRVSLPVPEELGPGM